MKRLSIGGRADKQRVRSKGSTHGQVCEFDEPTIGKFLGGSWSISQEALIEKQTPWLP